MVCLASRHLVSTQDEQPCDLHLSDDQEMEVASAIPIPFLPSPDVVDVPSVRQLRMPGSDPHIPLVETSVLWGGVYLSAQSRLVFQVATWRRREIRML